MNSGLRQSVVLAWLGSLASTLGVVAQNPISTFETNDPRVIVEVIAQGMPIPTSIDFTPDGRLFFLERETGNVRVFDSDFHLQKKPVITVPIAYNRYEAGAMGLAVSPVSSATRNVIYVSHVTAADTWSVSRFEEDGEGHGSDLQRVIDFPDCVVGAGEESRWHNIDSLHFGPNLLSETPEQLLYISFGDGGGARDASEGNSLDLAQDPSTVCGGLYGIDPNDPPRPEEMGTHNVCVGLRNSYDFCFHPLTRTIHMTENGFNSHDEVNRIQVGGNYGWPVVAGRREDSRFIDPILDLVWVTAPTGICVYQGALLPRQYQNQILFCEWQQGEIRVLELEDPSNPNSPIQREYYLLGDTDIFIQRPINHWGFIDMTPGPDGKIYLSAAQGAGPGVTGAILRLNRAETSEEPFSGIRTH